MSLRPVRHRPLYTVLYLYDHCSLCLLFVVMLTPSATPAPVLRTVDLSAQIKAAIGPTRGGSAQDTSLYNDVRLLCWILTHPGNHATKARAVKETWAPRCNKAVFMSSKGDPIIKSIDLKMSADSRDTLWEKSRKAWYYVYKNFAEDYDWFMKADDDTFVITENVRYLGSLHDPDGSYFFGRVFKPFGEYQSGGAGYVVSRGALKKVGPKLEKDELCAVRTPMVEDAKFGACLHEVGIGVGNSLESGKDRFHPFVPEQHLIPGIIPAKFWYRDYVKYPTTEGMDCCSDLSISFHYITPNLMRELYFYVYKLHPYGSRKADDLLPAPIFLRSKSRSVGSKLTLTGSPNDAAPAAKSASKDIPKEVAKEAPKQASKEGAKEAPKVASKADAKQEAVKPAQAVNNKTAAAKL